MKRVRFAPSPTGSLHVGNALSAVANRQLGDWMLLRIDDTDPARNVPGGEEELLHDLAWLGLEWDEGPVRQSERQERYREAAEPLGARFEGTTLLRDDSSATYQLASVVDDVDFGITHVVRGNDHRPNEPLQRGLFEALGAQPPEFVHHGLILGPDGKKLAKREPGATVALLREAGIAAPRRPLRPVADQAALGAGDRGHVRRGAGRAGRGAGRCGRRDAGRPRPRRGARVRRPRPECARGRGPRGRERDARAVPRARAR